ncbi:MAG: alpha-hydroxy-acid oxidizing protein, partial [Nitratireductor sp.]
MTHDSGAAAPGRRRQMEVYVTGAGGARPTVPVSAARLEARAANAMTPEAAAYVIGGAGLEASMAANRAAFERHRFVPRVLRDVSARDLSIDLFG